MQMKEAINGLKKQIKPIREIAEILSGRQFGMFLKEIIHWQAQQHQRARRQLKRLFKTSSQIKNTVKVYRDSFMNVNTEG